MEEAGFEMMFCWDFFVMLWTYGSFIHLKINNFEVWGECLESMASILFKINYLLGQASHDIIIDI